MTWLIATLASFIIMNYQGTCTLNAYVSCEIYERNFTLDTDEKFSQIHKQRDALRTDLAIPYSGLNVTFVRDKLKTRWLIKSRKEEKEYKLKKRSVIVYYAPKYNVNHAACIVGENEKEWIILNGIGWEFLVPKNWKHRFYSYEK